jgi:thiamine-monophosphate kinase
MTPGPATIAITALGEIATGRVIRRGGAATGDTVYVTGTIGDGALGLKAVRGELPELEPRAAGFLIDRYRVPRPRVALGPHLVGIASASLDVSDGLVADLRHLCEVSRVAAIVAAARVPLSPAARAAIRDDGDRLKAALTGGDDYEILFTAPASAAPAIAALSARLGVAITAIGEIVPRTPASAEIVVLDASGDVLPLDREGWQHF